MPRVAGAVHKTPIRTEHDVFTKRFALSALERATKTFAQTLIALWSVGDAALGLVDVDWKKAASVAGLAAVLSILTSVVSAPVGPDNSPSLVGEPPKQPEALLEDEPGDHALDGQGRDGAPEKPVNLFDPNR